jgi:hypothetical protein
MTTIPSRVTGLEMPNRGGLGSMPTDPPTQPPIPREAPAESPQAGITAELDQMVARFDEHPVRVREVLESTQGRGYHLLLLLIALPFVGPIPLPGFSIPFGLVVSLFGLRLALDRGPWLPQRWLDREVATLPFRRVVAATRRILRAMDTVVRPRLGFVPGHVVFSHVAGLMIAASGVMMMLPFPLPFSNSLPAWTVILLSAGALGRDGLLFFAGCFMFFASLIFFALVFFGGVEAVGFLQGNISR